MKLSEQRVGEIYLGFGSLIWSWFPMIVLFITTQLPPVFAAGIATSIAALFLAIIVTIRKEWKGIVNLEGLKNMVWVILCITVGMYALLFTAAQYTSTGNIAILGLTEKLWALLIFGAILKHEKINKIAILGSGLMLLGGILVLFPGEFKINIGDIMIIIAYALSSVGNIFQRRARQYMSAYQMLFIRSIIGGVILFGLSFILGEQGALSLPNELWLWLVAYGVLIFAIQKICWIEAIHRIPITKAFALTVVTPAMTLLWLFLFFEEKPTIYQWIGLIPITLGTMLIIYKKDIFTVLKK